MTMENCSGTLNLVDLAGSERLKVTKYRTVKVNKYRKVKVNKYEKVKIKKNRKFRLIVKKVSSFSNKAIQP